MIKREPFILPAIRFLHGFLISSVEAW